MNVKNKILDAIDIETFFICQDELEAKQLVQELLKELNLEHGDIVSLEHNGLGAQVRIRVYIHHPGLKYAWLEKEKE
ncbi:MAG: hypothetical protein N3A72_05545 [bacterium]|nr:hypothetical protein [bacterium]